MKSLVSATPYTLVVKNSRFVAELLTADSVEVARRSWPPSEPNIQTLRMSSTHWWWDRPPGYWVALMMVNPLEPPADLRWKCLRVLVLPMSC